MNLLEPILTYNLNEIEAKAFKLTLLWQVLSKKEFPNLIETKQTKSRDPRTTLLFKYCLKLAQETKGLIPDDEYKLYISAQLQTLRECADGLPIITPTCLIGIKAWRRWKLWKNRYNKTEKLLTGKSYDTITPIDQIKSHVLASSKFIAKSGMVNQEKLKKWVLGGDISPFYLILTKNQFIENNKIFGIDLSIYEISITEDVRRWFKSL